MAENTENKYLNKVPPHDNDAEQAVLACMLFDNEGARIAIEGLDSQDFYSPAHQLIFSAISDLYNGAMPVDIITTKNKLIEMGVLEKVGGPEYIIKLATLASTSANTKEYANIVKEKSGYRAIINIANKISDDSFRSTEGVDSILAEAENSIMNVAQNRRSENFRPIEEIVAEAIDKIEKVNQADNPITGIETGFTDFDRKTAGLQPSDLILIAARPSMGKTAFALNIAQYAAVEKGVPTAIFSLEMSAGQLMNRLLSVQSRIEAGKFRSAGLTSDEYERLAYAAGKIADSPLFIDDTSGITPTELKARCEKLKNDKTKGLGLIVIDYLQLINGGTGRKTDSVQQEVAYISKSLKGIARDLNVPVIALSQLSRAVESRSDKRPMLSDLRESGAIEQDADVVCFLYREQYYKPDTIDKKNQAEVIIAKQRNGPLGTVNLAWLGQYTKFENLEINEYDIDVSDLDDIENQ